MGPRNRKSFLGLLVAQFLGAFNDNCFRAILFLLALSGPSLIDDRRELTLGAAALFVIPFILFSTHSGRLADRFSKRSVTIAVKWLELGIMLLATVGLAWNNLAFLTAVLFLLAVQSALFSPTKYGILPELCEPADLPRANGLIELTTFVAIILGAVASSLLFPIFRDRLPWLGVLLAGLAGTGLVASLTIQKLPPAAPDRRVDLNPVPELRSALRAVFADRTLRLTTLGIAYFWSLAMLLDLTLFFYGMEMDVAKEVRETRIGYMRGLLAVGIGVGSWLAGYLSNKKPELGLVPVGSLGMGLLVILLFFAQGAFGWVLVGLAFLGVAGGFFIVPLNVLLQQEAPVDQKGRVIAGANLVTFSGMLVSLCALWAAMIPAGLSAGQVFLFVGLLTVASTVYVFAILPAAFFRFLFWLATHLVYRIRFVGRENLPTNGPALLVSNHVSFVDGLLVLASTHRFIRFLVYAGFTRRGFFRWLARTLRVIPVSPEEGPRAILESLREASRALESGSLVCIFAEGQISRTGQLLPFRGGVEKILKGAAAPVIPVYLDRVWGSIFSFRGERFFWKLPRRLPYPVTISFGSPLPPETSLRDIRQAVQELGSRAFMLRRHDQEPLGATLLRYCRRHPLGLAVTDATGARVSRGRLLTGATTLARVLARELGGEPMTGILLPPTVAGCLANISASLLGKPVVNFNYTVGGETLQKAAAQCGITRVITSRAFLDRVPIEVPGQPVYLEELRAKIGLRRRLVGALIAWAVPVSLLGRAVGGRHSSMEDVATVIFSSGSTGEPKGVELSHFNILSNVQAIAQAFNLRTSDKLLGILPFFHSTGYTVTLWTPLLSGMGVVYHPNPLDARTIGHLARKHACTMLVATPTFLQGFTKRCDPGDFGSLRYAMVGAEKLSDAVREGFRLKFGIEPMEGYGATECAPLVSGNVPDFRGPGLLQVGTKKGIGHPLPGVSVKIVDPETFEPVEPGREGLLLVKGPNVMKGYLGRPDLTAEVLRDGWYVTGDIASMDDDGFLDLTDRLSRFAKIGGEMVPHLKVEEVLNGLLQSDQKLLAVTSVPDPKKGERLAVVHVLDDRRLESLISRLPDSGLPNLWLPRRDAFVRTDELPVLGTGKLDLRRVREIAAQKLLTS